MRQAAHRMSMRWARAVDASLGTPTLLPGIEAGGRWQPH
jgi:hypothetical protein